jgi:hypothetical protein
MGEPDNISLPLAEASVVLGGDTEYDRGKLPPAGGTAALPQPAQGPSSLHLPPQALLL